MYPPRNRRMFSVFAAVCAAFCFAPGQPVAGEDLVGCDVRVEPFHPERLLVRFKAGVTRGERDATHQAAGAKGVLWDYRAVSGLQLVRVAPNELSAALRTYRDHPEVRYAEPDYTIYATEIPNDPDFGELWGLHNVGQTVNGDPGTPGADIRACGAWDLWTGDPDFRIAVIDTGVDYLHPDLQANIWTNPDEIAGNEIDDDGNGYVDDIHGYDFYDEDNDPMDVNSHGTHVAGTIAAAGNDGQGVVGVNWQGRIMPLRFLAGG